ncbi:hypothetical protein GCM10028797_16750 [Dyella agri]
MNVESVLKACGMTDAHFAVLGEAVPLGYRALQEVVKATPMLAQFMPGMMTVGYLRNLAVQYALANKAAEGEFFFVDTGFNKARNHAFAKLQAGNVVVTTHYAGAKGSRAVRKSLTRAALADRNGDLFSSDGQRVDADEVTGHAYVQLKHGGLAAPVFAALYIPNRDQRSIALEPLILELATPDNAKVEEVTDRLRDTIKRKGQEDQRDRHAS